MARRIRAHVTGHVQGVSYRASAAAHARRLGLVGWVRNLPDGSVELEAEGDDAPLAELVAWCEHGPPAARVTRVRIEELEPTGAERAFITR
ncbi:MAG TPA: acylphosphatase [Kofleriaceae bacterium]|nr:acylphosphatase [Kofleriaceae bacterium]